MKQIFTKKFKKPKRVMLGDVALSVIDQALVNAIEPLYRQAYGALPDIPQNRDYWKGIIKIKREILDIIDRHM